MHPAPARCRALAALLCSVSAALVTVAGPARAVDAGNEYFLTNRLTGGPAEVVFQYGSANDVVLVGDWNADGRDTLGVRRGNVYYLTNNPTGGVADTVFRYGSANDVVLVGDWNGDGRDTLGVRRGNVYYLTNGTTGGYADITFRYGSGSDVVIVGDWNADGRDSLGVRRVNDYYLTNGTTGGYADITFRYGSGSDVVIVGDWNADRIDTLGVRRVAVPRIPGDGTYRVNTDIAPGLYRTTDTAGGCYWERRSDLTGGTAGILANDFGTGPRYVQILATDVGFATEGCGTWTMVTAAYRPYPRAPGEGQWLVNRDIPAGTYRVSNAQDCYWARVSGFSGDIDEILANDIASGTVTVTVEPTDFGFTSQGCGQWTRL